MEQKLKIRIGNLDDLDGVMALATAATAENGFVDADPQCLLNDIYPSLNRHHGIMGIIGDSVTQPEAAVLLRIGKMWYSTKDVIEEKAIFVHPDFRNAKGGRAARLCEFSKKVADALELPLIIGVLSNHRTKGKVKMYQRIFGEPSGAFFLYNAQTGASSAEH